MTTRTISRLTGVDRLQRFKEAVANAPGNHYFNIIVAQVDPDALGSALGVAEILESMGKSTAIWYSGGISHPQNKVLRNRFNLGAEISHISKFTPQTDPETGDWLLSNNLVLVDSCLGDDSRLRCKMQPWIVIDHHRHSDLVDSPQFADGENGFLWLDESAGSACTLVTELLQQAIQDSVMGIVGHDWSMSEKVATLLAMGIYTDTTNLVSAGKRDREAYGWLQQYTNDGTISDIIDYPLEEANFNHMFRAFDPANRKQHNAHLLSGLGLIDSEYADDLSTVCNMFLRKPGVEIAITWAGVVFTDEDTGEETVKLRVCARSRSLVIDLADFLRKRFKGKCGAKQLPNGRGEGGALFELDFDGWMQRNELLEIVGRRLREWLFDEEATTQDG